MNYDSYFNYVESRSLGLRTSRKAKCKYINRVLIRETLIRDFMKKPEFEAQEERCLNMNRMPTRSIHGMEWDLTGGIYNLDFSPDS